MSHPTLAASPRPAAIHQPSGGAPKVALALGAGGARGLAHIPVLEALDDLGIRPVAIAGTSIGAIVGAAYAAGIPARTLRRHALATFRDQGRVAAKLLRARVGRFVDLIGAGGNPVLVDGERILADFWPEGVPDTFEALKIPFIAIAADVHKRAEARMTTGDLKQAVAASMAIPGIVKAVARDAALLVDGAVVNPVPVGPVAPLADFVIAVDLNAGPGPNGAGGAGLPSAYSALFTGFQIMEHQLMLHQFAKTPPAMHLVPNVSAFGVLEFLKASAILRAADPIREEVKRKLARAIEAA